MATWFDGVTLNVLIYDVGPLPDLDTSLAATSYNVTDYIRRDPGITISRGRSDELDTFGAGTIRFTLRNDGRWFDPSDPQPGESAEDFTGILKPGRRVQVAADGHTLGIGFIEGWPQTWDPSDNSGSVEIVAYDMTTLLARIEVAESTFVLDDSHRGRLDRNRVAGDMPEQYTGERVAALLGLGGVPSLLWASIDTGKTLMPATTPMGSLLTSIRAAEAAEAGFFYVSRGGVITFRDRHSRWQDDDMTTVQATFTQGQYTGLRVDYDWVKVWNDVRRHRDGGVLQQAVDDTSIGEYGRRISDETLEVISDGEALARAQFWRDRYSEPAQRPTPVQIRPRKDPATLFPAVLPLDLLSRVVLTRTPGGVGSEASFEGLIEKIEHRITGDDWVTTIATSPADLVDGDLFLVLDDSSDGLLDTGTLAY